MQRFHFADAFWFRLPLKVVVVLMTAFALVTLAPAFNDEAPGATTRALFGLTVALAFVGFASIFIVAVNDSYIELHEDTLFVRFESFFSMNLTLSEIAAVRAIEPPRSWRYRFGLSTDFRERIACSHGGGLVEIQLWAPRPTRMGLRRIGVTRLWLGVREREAFLKTMDAALHSTRTPARLAA